MEQESIQDVRQDLRSRMMKARDALTPAFRSRSNQAITQQLRGYLSEKDCHSIHCYISFRSEVDTRSFIELELQDGIRVTVPIVERIGELPLLAHTEIRSLADLVPGPFGVEEPAERIPAALENVDVVIIPLVAFDRHGARLGYGRGFYDRFLRTLPRTVERIGLAFSIQEAEHIPTLTHDEPLDTIITEQEIIHTNTPCRS